MTLPPGTEMGKDGLLEVREGDWVEVEVRPVFPKTWFGDNLPLEDGMVLPDLRAKLRGSTVAPEEKDGDCDFVLLDESPLEAPSGQKSHPLFRVPKRYPILTNLRDFEPASPLDESNCDLYEQEPESDFFGRGNFRLLDSQGNHAKWAKGILSDNRNKLSYVLVKRVSDSEILLRQRLAGDSKRDFVISLETYIIEEVLYFPVLKAFVTRLTLKEELLNGLPVKLPRQIYFIEGQECLENIELLDGLYATCRCDDGEDYFGWVEYDGDFGLKLNLDKSKRALEDDYIRVVLDDPDMIQNYQNITRVFGEISTMNGFRAGGPWIARKQTKDASTFYEYKVPTCDLGVGTESPTRHEKSVGTEAPKMVTQMVDAVGEPEGLRLDNL